MEGLAKRKGLKITNADKGDAVFIMDTRNYIKEADRQDINSQDPALQHNRKVQK